MAPERPRLLVVTVGKAHGDAMEACRLLGHHPDSLARAGVAVLKVGLVHPLDVAGISSVAAGVETVLVIEEKAPLVERQLRDGLYDLPAERRPRILGKHDAEGRPLVPEIEELRPSRLVGILGRTLRGLGLDVSEPDAPVVPPASGPLPVRTPYFCSGCPHNTSTRVPEGSQARAGIGCHFMANWMERDTTGIVPMGAEGSTGPARRRSPARPTSSRISATEPISIPATRRSGRRSRAGRTSPTRSSTTTPWR